MKIARMPDGQPEIYPAIQAEGATIGKPMIFVRTSTCNLFCKWCFVGNTWINTPRGKKRIKDIQLGDKVLSSKNGKIIDIKSVTKVFKRIVTKEEIVKVQMEGNCEYSKIYCTKNHRFLTSKGWVKAENLESDMEILYINANKWTMKNRNPIKFMSEKTKKIWSKKCKQAITGQRRTFEQRLKIRKSKLGKKNLRYIGDRAEYYPGYLYMWDRVRNDILKRDNYICQDKDKNCNTKNSLEVHHIIPFRIIKKHIYNLLITVCKYHHLLREKKSIHNGKKVISVTKVNIKQAARFNNDSSRIEVYNLEVKDNHTYFANNLLVHNCDSSYTWNFEDTGHKHSSEAKVNVLEKQLKMTPEQVANHILKYELNCRNVVFTGGEPTIQQKDIIKVIQYIETNNNVKYSADPYYFEIETNGTMKIDTDLHECIHQINCSPKLASSGAPECARSRPQVIKQFIELAEEGALNLCFKFVVGRKTYDTDFKEIGKWMELNHIKNKNGIYLMPEGVDSAQMIEDTRWLSEMCLNMGFNLSTRLQIILYGNKRAV